ncbi:hypothetical protein [Acidithiobacillus thiooxidans]|nr:hypothetical protein [Acidithiobacillus thiooxidans]
MFVTALNCLADAGIGIGGLVAILFLGLILRHEHLHSRERPH